MQVTGGPGLTPPITTTFQPGSQNERAGTADQRPLPNQVQPRSAAAADSQKSEEDRRLRGNEERQSAANNDRPAFGNSRGSLLDITV